MDEKRNSYDTVREAMTYWENPKIETYVRWRTTHIKRNYFIYGFVAGMGAAAVVLQLFQ